MVKVFECIKIYFSLKSNNPMFYVEHPMKNYFLSFLLLFLSSCHSRDLNPEQKDLVFNDFKKEIALVDKSIEVANKDLEDRRIALRGVVPQTGQLKSIEKKVFESEDYLEKLSQQKRFFEIKLEQRKQLVTQKYEESLRGGPAWPDKKEIEDYEAEIKMQRAKIKWDKDKGMIKKVLRGTIVDEDPGKKQEP